MASPRLRFASLLALVLLVQAIRSFAQLTIVSASAGANQIEIGKTYLQKFNALITSGSATWSDNSTLPGWYTSGGGTTLIATGTGPLNTTAGTIYSLPQHFQDNITTSGYRSLGAAPDANSGPIHFAARFVNNTGSVVSSLRVAYEVRFGYSYDALGALVGGTNTVTCRYQTFSAGAGSITGTSGSWTTAATTDAANVTTSKVPDDWNYVIKTITGLNLQPGAEIWIDWQIALTNGNPTITAIDNVTVGSFTTGNPAIVTQPLSSSILTGNKLVLEALGTGSPAPTVQWHKNGVPIAGATSNTLTISAVQPTDAGDYTFIVSNTSGTAISNIAPVRVYNALGVKGPAAATTSGSVPVTISGSLTTPAVTYTGDVALQDIRYLPISRSENADLYLPNPMPSSLRPAVIIIHGGGGNDGSKDDDREVSTGQEFARRGYVAMSINYKRSFSLGGGFWSVAWPQNIKDAKTAVRFLRANASTYNIDPNRIGVIGFSWGGNEAAMLATTRPSDGLEPTDDYSPLISSSVSCASNFYGAVSIPEYHNMNQFGGGGNTDPGAMDYTGTNNYLKASPVSYAHSAAAPLFLLHGDADLEVMPTQNALLHAALVNANAPVHAFQLVPKGLHSHALYDTTHGGTAASPIDVRPQTFGFYDQYLLDAVEPPADLVLAAGSTADLNVLTNVRNPLASLLSFTQAQNGSVIHLGSGLLRYAPNLGFTGSDTFTYTLSDGNGGTSTTTVSISILSGFNKTVATEATIDSSIAGSDFNEASSGYLAVKYSSAVSSARKTYFQFDVSGLSINPEASGTFTINFTNSYQQWIKLWGLKQAYPSLSSTITWNNAQANDTASNGMLTSGSSIAAAITSSTLIVPGSSPYTPCSIVIPRLGDFVYDGRITLVMTGTLEASGTNHSSGLRLARNSTTLQFSANNAPTIAAIASQTMQEDTVTAPIAITLSDAETAAGSLTLTATSSNPTLLPPSAFTFGGSGSSRTLVLTPAANQNGSAIVTVTVSDGVSSTNTNFLVTVTPDTPTTNWKQSQFGGNASNSAVAGDPRDPDQDGIPNLIEYALGTNPNAFTASACSLGTLAINGTTYLTLTYTRLKAATDIILTPEASGDLAAWQSGPDAVIPVIPVIPVSTVDNGLTETVVVRDAAPIVGNSRRFLHLKVTRP